MRILYDHQIFSAQKYGGVSRYHAELHQHLNNIEGIGVEISLKYTENIYLNRLSNYKLKNTVHFSNKYLTYLSEIFYSKLNQIYSNECIRKSNFDLLHPTYYDPYFLPKLKKPLIITVHDLIHERFADGISKRDKTIMFKELLSAKAIKILANSHSTKKDLINLIGVDSEKIIVTHLSGGFEKPLKILNKTEIGLPEKYILFVGSRQWYKNFIRFFDAVTPLLISDKTLKIVCTGSEFTKSEIQMFEKSGVRNQMVRYFCNEDDFYYVYNFAELFVFPSEYEGFGIPTLEAFSADCPVVLSNTSSMPEVGGDAVLYIDPYDVADIRSKIEQLLFDKDLRLKLIEKGRKQLEKFNWEKTAKETLKVYESL